MVINQVIVIHNFFKQNKFLKDSRRNIVDHCIFARQTLIATNSLSWLSHLHKTENIFFNCIIIISHKPDTLVSPLFFQ